MYVDVRMRRCEGEKMICIDVKMRRCENEKMMCRCEDEKMLYRPPLLEEPFAQTLSGKSVSERLSVKGSLGKLVCVQKPLWFVQNVCGKGLRVQVLMCKKVCVQRRLSLTVFLNVFVSKRLGVKVLFVKVSVFQSVCVGKGSVCQSACV